MESSRIIISHLLPCAEYSANNAFNYNGNNGNLNNNNKNNTNSCRAVLELGEPNNANLEILLDASEYYMIQRKEAEHIIQEVVRSISEWKTIATRLGIAKREYALFEKRLSNQRNN